MVVVFGPLIIVPGDESGVQRYTCYLYLKSMRAPQFGETGLFPAPESTGVYRTPSMHPYEWSASPRLRQRYKFQASG